MTDSTPCRSQLHTSPCLWQPQEREMKLVRHPEPEAEGHDYPDFLYLYLTREFTIAVGRHRGHLAADAAAMRKLSALAAQAADLLDKRIAQPELPLPGREEITSAR